MPTDLKGYGKESYSSRSAKKTLDLFCRSRVFLVRCVTTLTRWLWFYRLIIPVTPSFRRRPKRVPPNDTTSRFIGLGDKS